MSQPPSPEDPARPTEADFARAVEQTFQRLRERPSLLSPEDFQRVLRWHRTGIPLGLVLTTMKVVFQRAASSRPRRRPSSLAYCEGAIEEAWEASRDIRVGSRAWTAAPDPDLAEELERAARCVLESGAPEETRTRIATRLRALALGDSSFTDRVDAVAAVDGELLAACRLALEPEQAASLARETEKQVAPYLRRLSPPDLERTTRLVEARHLRRLFRLPDISLLPLVASGGFPGPGEPGGGAPPQRTS